MKRLTAIGNNFSHNLTVRKVIAAVLGNIILGFGCAGLKLSLMGNEPYTAVNLAMSEGFHMGLGNYQLIVNALLFIIQLIWGYTYIGFGSLVNLVGLGYIIQGADWVLATTIGDCTGKSLIFSLLYMAVSMVVLTFGLGMYQEADVGLSPYDYLSNGMCKALKWPFFLCRVLTDTVCVIVIIVAVFTGFIGWENAHLGVGTIIGAFCLGPLVAAFRKLNGKWITPSSR